MAMDEDKKIADVKAEISDIGSSIKTEQEKPVSDFVVRSGAELQLTEEVKKFAKAESDVPQIPPPPTMKELIQPSGEVLQPSVEPSGKVELPTVDSKIVKIGDLRNSNPWRSEVEIREEFRKIRNLKKAA